MSFQEQLRAKLTGASAVTAVCGTRIYYRKARPNQTFPLIMFSLDDREQDKTINAATNGLIHDIWRVECWGTEAQAEAMADAVEAALVAGAWGTYAVQYCRMESMSDEEEEPTPDVTVFGRILSFDITYR